MFTKKIALALLAIAALYISSCKPKGAGNAVSGDAASKPTLHRASTMNFTICVRWFQRAAKRVWLTQWPIAA